MVFLRSGFSASQGPPLVMIVWPSVQRRLEAGIAQLALPLSSLHSSALNWSQARQNYFKWLGRKGEP